MDVDAKGIGLVYSRDPERRGRAGERRGEGEGASRTISGPEPVFR
ncbi:MAG: hypothetical protein AVDCRST_MAG25-3652 [uncultured Rubrobacteraceae bacterium]|uniref:Uncharacterized protein n=1 Tax=uncultured Rubrobacteraceae bacterium TaxID=349277 RepID=A0A6J4SD40_9ACTN|nr:MAG: hypothetical protein AVDCRST_MAG25-3652 [uncultured Rubrobacteraceae bacterium]